MTTSLKARARLLWLNFAVWYWDESYPSYVIGCAVGLLWLLFGLPRSTAGLLVMVGLSVVLGLVLTVSTGLTVARMRRYRPPPRQPPVKPTHDPRNVFHL